MSNPVDIAKADYLAAERETLHAWNARDHASKAMTDARIAYRNINAAYHAAFNNADDLKARYRAAQDVANTLVEDVIKMTRTSYERWKSEDFFGCVPDDATIIYYDPRNGTMAYRMPDGPMPFGYINGQLDSEFATEAEMLAQFVVDMATL